MPEKLFPKKDGEDISKLLDRIFTEEQIQKAHDVVKERYIARSVESMRAARITAKKHTLVPIIGSDIPSTHRLQDMNAFIKVIGVKDLTLLLSKLKQFGEVPALDHIIASSVGAAYTSGFLEQGENRFDSAKEVFGPPVELTATGVKTRSKKATHLLNSMKSDIGHRHTVTNSSINASTWLIVALKHKILCKCADIDRYPHQLLAKRLDSEANKFFDISMKNADLVEKGKQAFFKKTNETLHKDAAIVRTNMNAKHASKTNVKKKRAPRKFSARFAA